MTDPANIEPAPAQLVDLANAGLLRRFGALLYDGLLVLALVLMTTGITNLFMPRPEIPPGAETASLEGLQTFSGPLLSTLLFLQTFAFFAWFWTRHGRTLGMQAWRVRVIQHSGRPITLTQSLIRVVVAIPSLLLFGLGYLWVLVDPSGSSWPDRASATRTVHVPAELTPHA